MKQFNIVVPNEVGSLADVCETLMKNGVNIEAIATEAVNRADLKIEEMPRNGVIKIVTGDLTTTRNALKRRGFSFTEEEIIPLELMDRPGELGKVARKLANEGISVESVFILGKKGDKTSVALTVDKLARAKEILK